ncbi:hypothetical protein [uncultured Thiothrix sp.]|uniref:hypothetical protein n=1 Tax=uncultured Thiothrix sp. TaxID=223185 RepID=UPI00260E8E38|nr:hypothetical protein [uncultured Thiothrix sp.]
MKKSALKQQEQLAKQTQNEALVRLMLLARYQDKKLSLSEQDAFNRSLQKIEWHSVTDVTMFTMREIASVRKALETPEKTETFIQQQCVLFTNSEAKNQCLAVLRHIAAADKNDLRENQFIHQVEAALGMVSA